MPDWARFNLRSWETFHPDWEIRVWDDAELDAFISITRHLWETLDRYLKPHAVWQGRSDLFRYEVLYRNGGVYADADFQCRSNIDDLLTPAWTAWEVQDRWANMAISGFEAGHPFLAECLDGLEVNHRRYARNPAWGSSPTSGPRYLTPILKRHPEITVYPAAWFYPFPWNQPQRASEEFPEARAVHQFAHAAANL